MARMCKVACLIDAKKVFRESVINQPCRKNAKKELKKCLVGSEIMPTFAPHLRNEPCVLSSAGRATDS